MRGASDTRAAERTSPDPQLSRAWLPNGKNKYRYYLRLTQLAPLQSLSSAFISLCIHGLCRELFTRVCCFHPSKGHVVHIGKGRARCSSSLSLDDLSLAISVASSRTAASFNPSSRRLGLFQACCSPQAGPEDASQASRAHASTPRDSEGSTFAGIDCSGWAFKVSCPWSRNVRGKCM